MRIPERPTTTADLNLMQRLLAYADGKASWLPGNESLGRREQDACRDLHAKLLTFIDELIHPLLDRVTSREMEGFTMHDRYHGLKVAHLMWHITKPTRRELLTPPEIALLVMSAHFHDLGMGLSADERRARLTPDSDLWDRVEGHAFYIKALDALGVQRRTPTPRPLLKLTPLSKCSKHKRRSFVQTAGNAMRHRHAIPNCLIPSEKCTSEMPQKSPTLTHFSALAVTPSQPSSLKSASLTMKTPTALSNGTGTIQTNGAYPPIILSALVSLTRAMLPPRCAWPT